MIPQQLSWRIAELRETFARIMITRQQAMRLRAKAALLRREAGVLRCDTARLSKTAKTARAAATPLIRQEDATATGNGADLA